MTTKGDDTNARRWALAPEQAVWQKQRRQSMTAGPSNGPKRTPTGRPEHALLAHEDRVTTRHMPGEAERMAELVHRGPHPLLGQERLHPSDQCPFHLVPASDGTAAFRGVPRAVVQAVRIDPGQEQVSLGEGKEGGVSFGFVFARNPAKLKAELAAQRKAGIAVVRDAAGV